MGKIKMANCTKNSIGNLRELVILTNSGRDVCARPAKKLAPMPAV